MERLKTLKKIIFGFYLLLFVLSIIVLSGVNYRLFKDPSADERLKDCQAQLNFLDKAISEGAAENMQSIFPEGYFFTNVLYGLSCVEYCRELDKGDSLYVKYLNEAESALKRIESDYCRDRFSGVKTLSRGAFYLSWSAWLRGKILSINSVDTSDAQYIKFRGQCDEIAETYLREMTPYPESYPTLAWPADAMPGIAALKLSDHYFGTDHSPFVKQWINAVKEKIDPETGLIAHKVDHDDGHQLTEPRGSSQALMLRFLYEIDPEFAQVQYSLFRKNFYVTRLGFPAVDEYPIDTDGEADIDSGPLIFGVGPAALIVSSGTARFFDDSAAGYFYSTLEALGLSSFSSTEKYYVFGQMPVSDAFIVWSRLSEPIVEHNFNQEYDNSQFESSRLNILLISAAFILLNIVVIARLRMKKKLK